MYQSLYDLIHQYIYSGVTMTSEMELTCTLISTIGCIAVIAIPFFVVFKVISWLFDVMR